MDSPIYEQRMGDLRIPGGVRIVCIIQNNKVVYPKLDTKMQLNDKVIIFTNLRDSSKLVPLVGRDSLPGL